MSAKVVTFKYVVQLVPYVKGQVVKSHAQANQPLKKGDPLLDINPEPYQYTLNSAKAQLDASRGGVQEAKANVEVTRADVTKAKAGVNQAVAAVNQTKAAVTSAKAALTQAKAAVAPGGGSPRRGHCERPYGGIPESGVSLPKNACRITERNRLALAAAVHKFNAAIAAGRSTRCRWHGARSTARLQARGTCIG